jgi:hypothetical protein
MHPPNHLVPLFVAVFSMLLHLPPTVRGDEAIRLDEKFPVGCQYHVSTRVDLSGVLTPPADKGKPAAPLTVKGDSAIEYDERVLAVSSPGDSVNKTARVYRRIDFQRTVGDRPQQATIRPEVRRLVLLRKGNAEVPFSPDGPLTWGEIDQVRTDVFTPALTGLLPERPVRSGDRWSASNGAVLELTDLERLAEGQLDCRLEQVTVLEKRRHARIAFSGTVRGTNEDGPNRQTLDGYLYFDLDSNHVSYLYLKGISVLLDKDGREVGRIEGRFVLSRRVHTRCPELSDEGLKAVALEPSADNTQLLYDNPDLGVRFLYARRWRVAGVRGNQVALDGADGSGMLLTVEPPAKVPTGAAFLIESRDWLAGQKARVLRAEPPRSVQASPPLEHFALEAEIAGQRVLMDYYVTRQPAGGVTLAARLLPNGLAALQIEVERIARSIVVEQKSQR